VLLASLNVDFNLSIGEKVNLGLAVFPIGTANDNRALWVALELFDGEEAKTTLVNDKRPPNVAVSCAFQGLGY
jgi:hypothetical protein